MAIFASLGPYKIVRRLGRGGMGDVYLAEDTRKPEGTAQRRVALKVIHRDDDSSSTAIMQAERQGAQLQTRLYAIEERVACIRDYGILEDVFFIDMEYIEGRDLSDAIAEGPMKSSLALHIAYEVADILTRCHTLRFEHESVDSQGVIHGDIKPRNIRLGADGRVRLMDFGIAKALSMTRKLTRNEFGSVSYASPERLDTGKVDLQSDLWSLSVVLYEMLAGRTPFESENTRKIEQSILQGAVCIPLPADTLPEVRAFLSKALALKPEGRFSSASHYKLALKGLLNQNTTGNNTKSLQDRAAYASNTTQESSPVARPSATDIENLATQKVQPVARPVEEAQVANEELTRRTVRPPNQTPAAPTAPSPVSKDSERLITEETDRLAGVSPRNNQDEAFQQNQAKPKKASWLTRGLIPKPSESPNVSEVEPLTPAGPSHPTSQPAAPAATGSGEPVAVTVQSFPPTWLYYVLLALVVVGVGVVKYQHSQLEEQRSELLSKVQARELSCSTAYSQYEQLNDKPLSNSGDGQLRGPLEQLCSNELEVLLQKYYDLDAKLKKSDWEEANANAKRLLKLSPSPKYQAWELYTTGQLKRIQERFDEAIPFLQKAAEQDAFCDPYLALMHLYAYSKRRDLTGFIAAQEQARQRGCNQTRFDIWRADIERDTAIQKYDELSGLQPPNTQEGLGERIQQYQQVELLLRSAISVYDQNRKIGNSKKLSLDCNKRLKAVQAKLNELQAYYMPLYNFHE